jgi:hypothetical protein
MAKKDKKPKLPKKVGGVKLSKQLRKSAGVVAEIAQNPIAREVVSAALVAGAAALTKRRVKNASGPATGSKPGNELDGLITQGKEVGNILAQGVTAFLNTLMKPIEKKAGSEAKPAPSAAAPVKPTNAKRTPAKRPAAKRAATAAKPRAKSKPTP